MVRMERVSTHKKTRTGSKTPQSSILSKTIINGQIVYDEVEKGGVQVGATTEGHGQYVFVYNKGSVNNPRVISETKHCSEAQAKAYKEQLEKAGY